MIGLLKERGVYDKLIEAYKKGLDMSEVLEEALKEDEILEDAFLQAAHSYYMKRLCFEVCMAELNERD